MNIIRFNNISDKRVRVEKVATGESLGDTTYGIKWTRKQADPNCERTGNLELHKTLPIQSAMKGCIYDGSKVVYYLNPNDWTLPNSDGITPVFDGTDGYVKVEIPEYYIRSWEHEDGTNEVKVSLYPVDDTWIKVPKMYLDAYCTNADIADDGTVNYVGSRGNYDGTEEDTIAFSADSTYIKPTTNYSIAQFRENILKAAGYTGDILCYDYHKYLSWLIFIEYATFNIQADYNPELTEEGYHQGGLGACMTTKISEYNYKPMTPCGYANNLGNNTGVKDFTLDSGTYQVSRYRGIENLVGDIAYWLEGLVLVPNPDDPENYCDVYKTSNPELYNNITIDDNKSSVINTENWDFVCSCKATTNIYVIEEFKLGETAEIIPTDDPINAVSDFTIFSTYKCDAQINTYTQYNVSLFVGGYPVADGPVFGLVFFYAVGVVGVAVGFLGFRTTHIQK